MTKKRASGLEFKATSEQRAQVSVLSMVGTPQSEIAKIIGISEMTLRKHFREELDLASSKANAKVGSTLYKMATSGDCVPATIFWAKTRMGWREKDIEISDKQSPINLVLKRGAEIRSKLQIKKKKASNE